jgi:hypothetical protein
VYPTDALLALGEKAVPLSAASLNVSPIAKSGATTFRLRLVPGTSNCSREEERARVVAFFDGEPLRFRGDEDSFDVVVPAGTAVELPLTFDGLPVDGSHWIEFWAIWSPTRIPVAELRSSELNNWAPGAFAPQRVAVLLWDTTAR